MGAPLKFIVHQGPHDIRDLMLQNVLLLDAKKISNQSLQGTARAFVLSAP